LATRGKPQPHPFRRASTFIGREQELVEVQRLLRPRLLTLTGPGGCARCAGAARGQPGAARFADGVWLTEFAPLADPGLVPQAVATTLGIHEQPGRPLSKRSRPNLAAARRC
jgi:predicted ATPase